MGFGLLLGLGTIPLRQMVPRRLLRMGLDTGLRMGTGMGILEKRRRLLRLGSHGTESKYQYPCECTFNILDIPSKQVYVSP
jgi:hypothetical protein